MPNTPLRCLIVEDEPLAAEILEEYISMTPFLTLTHVCPDAISALDVVHSEPVDVIFLDINLPKLNGLDFIKTLRRQPKISGLLSRLSLLEKIPLTPEGVTLEEALRGIDIAIDDNLPVIVLSFHSPSLVPGHTPYVRSEDALDRLYDWLRGVYGYLMERGVAPTTVSAIMNAVER